LGTPFQSKSQKAISYQLISLSAIRDDRQMAMKKFTLDLEKVLPGKKVFRYLQVENKLEAIGRYELAKEIPLAQ
jgi:hypothetical protein